MSTDANPIADPALASSRPGRRPAIPLVVRLAGLSLKVSRRTLGAGAAVAIAVVAAALYQLTIGEYAIALGEMLDAALGRGREDFAFVLRGIRLPRVLVALGVGLALAMSGAIFQGMVRNPLVSPDIIGINAGASVVAVFLIVTGSRSAVIPAAAFVGAVVTAFVIYALTWRKGIAGNRLVLVGIGVNAILTSLVTLITVRYPVQQVSEAVLWLSGSLHGRQWTHAVPLAGSLLVLVPAALVLSRQLKALQLGDDAARGLGARAELVRSLLILVGAGLAATAVAAAGPVGFVALMTPHIARMIAGPLTGGVLVLSGLLGAVLVVVSDIIAVSAFAPITLPVGVVTAAVGAPYFLYLLVRSDRVTS
jgi:iron complex transport system permease protein